MHARARAHSHDVFVCARVRTHQDRRRFLTHTLSRMLALAERLPALFPPESPLLAVRVFESPLPSGGHSMQYTELTREQAAALLVHAFLGTIPEQAYSIERFAFLDLMSCTRLVAHVRPGALSRAPRAVSPIVKMRCLVEYFMRVMDEGACAAARRARAGR